MRLPTFFVICLLLAAVFNFVQAAERLYQLRVLPPALTETHPLETFSARLDSVSDPAELRRLALARHQALLDRDHVAQGMFATVRTMSRSDLVQSGMVFLLALGVYFFDRPARHPEK